MSDGHDPHDERSPHPADPAPIQRAILEIGADALGLLLAVSLRLGGAKPLPVEVDFAALISVLENVPFARRLLEHRFGRAATELALSIVGAVDRGLLQGIGPLVDMSVEAVRLRALLERKRAWEEGGASQCGVLHPPPHHPRAEPMRPGPSERYANKAAPASLLAFLLGLIRVRSVEGSAALIFAGLPKPTRHSKEAFSAHVGYRLSKRRMLVYDIDALDRLENIEALVISEKVVEDSGSAAFRRLIEEAKSVVRTAVVPEASTEERIRKLQQGGSGVAFFGPGPKSSLLAADLGVYVCSECSGPDEASASADVVCTNGIADALVILQAIKASRKASTHGVVMSLAEAATSLILLSGGLGLRTTRRVMGVANIASLASIANGVRLAHEATREPRPIPKTVPDWHALEAEAVLDLLRSRVEGLFDDEITARVAPEAPPLTSGQQLLRFVFDELDNPLTPILAIGAGISGVVGSILDTGLIGSVIGINSLIGAKERLRVEGTLRRLANGHQEKHTVRRNGGTIEVLANRLVPGDVLILEAGEVVPADCRILSANALEIDESSLTGESLPVVKDRKAVPAAAVADRTSMLYAGTSIVAGSAEAAVVAVGDDTESRRALKEAGSRRHRSGVEKRLETLTRMTVPAAGAAGLLVAVSGLIRKGDPAEVLNAGVSLALSSVPEGLPILATLAQLAAAERLSKQGALARNPRALEALGRVTVLCADKTGTLTEGQIRLIEVSDGRSTEKVGHLGQRSRDVLAAAVRASPKPNGTPLFHLTDRALIEGAGEEQVAPHTGCPGWTRTAELPFEPGRGYHATKGDGRLSVKGAPEVVLARCCVSEAERSELIEAAHQIAERGLRVLAVAERESDPEEPLEDRAVADLGFLGFVSFADRIRATATQAVLDLKRAGVEIVMLTGDHPATAETIAESLGIKDGKRVMTGPELDLLDERELDRRIGGVSVFARVTPEQKVRIVGALQRNGAVVAMTGDGANDAPAIRLADVGIALGQGSADATRKAADIVVTDERIETIVQAVLEGRALWASVREAIALLVGGNLGEIVFTLIGALLDGRSPLTPRQLLLLNLLTDALPATAIALRPPHHKSAADLLHEGPDASLGSALTKQIAWRGILTAGAAAGAWLAARASSSKERAKSVALLALTGAQLGQTMVASRYSAWAVGSSMASMAALVGIIQIQPLSVFFGSRPVGPLGLIQAGAAAACATALSIAGPKMGSNGGKVLRRLRSAARPRLSRARGPRKLRAGSSGS